MNSPLRWLVTAEHAEAPRLGVFLRFRRAPGGAAEPAVRLPFSCSNLGISGASVLGTKKKTARELLYLNQGPRLARMQTLSI
jgi:hypothetical protein